MKKTAILLIVASTLTAFLSACGYNTYTIEKIGDVMDSSEDEQAYEEAVRFSVEVPSDDFLAATDYYFLYDDESGEYEKLLFKTDDIVSDFKFFTVEYRQGEDMKTNAVKCDIIFTKRTLTPDKPIVVDVKCDGATAVRGISFVDSYGEVNYYAITSASYGTYSAEKVQMLDHSGISAMLADSEYLSNTDAYFSYEDKKEELTKVVYKTAGKATSFRFLSIEPVDTEKDNGKYKVKKVLYTAEAFDSEKDFVAETAFADVYPQRAVSFVDEHGVTRYFTISDDASGNKKIYIEEVSPIVEE